MLWAAAFWISVAAILYGYVGFPLLVAVVGWIRSRGVRKEPITPPVSLIIAAYNEEDGIEGRIQNALHTDYPEDALEIIVASDGSTDATDEIVSRFDSERVRLLSLPRQGKAYALNEAVRHSRGDILVFSDANTLFEPDALRALVRNFADPEVGGVAGHTGYVTAEDGESAGLGETLYWRYDTWLKRLETRTGSVVSAHGGMYAIRKVLFEPIWDAAVTDDFAISTAVVEQGWRLVFEPGARGWEAPVKDSGKEFSRRVRLMTRGIRGALVLRRSLLAPGKYGFYSVSLFSHKVLRRVLPLFLPVLFVSSIALAAEGWVYMLAAGAQGLFYAFALGGWALRGSAAGRWKPFYVPFFYVMANLASVVALWDVARGHRIERWNPQRHEHREVAGQAASGNGARGGGTAVRAEAETNGRGWIPKDWATAGENGGADSLGDVEPALDGKRLRYCVLRRTGAPWPEKEASSGVDLLVHPDDASALEREFLERNFLLFPPAGSGYRSHLLGRGVREGEWDLINVRTELVYGRPVPCLRGSQPTRRLLKRRVRRKGRFVLSPEDELVDLLLHALLDEGRIDAAEGLRLQRLIGELRRCPPLAGRAAERVQFELAPALTWEDLLHRIQEGEWHALRRTRRALALRLARSEPLRTLGRVLAGSRGVLARPPLAFVTNRGRVAALLAPDGGGKSTVARSLARSAPVPARVIYAGCPAPLSHVHASLQRPIHFWWKALRIRWLRAVGYLVITDRYVFDGWVDDTGLDPERRSWRRRFLEWPFPRPDLVVVLDAPGEELYRRSGQRSPATLERRRQAYVSLRERIPGVVVVDATQPEEEVLEAVTSYLWRDDRRTAARRRWTG